jgi:hypothetical protein
MLGAAPCGNSRFSMRLAIMRRIVLLSTLALIATPTSSILAQRVATSGVQRLEVAPAASPWADTSTTRPRSHVDGAVHGGAVGLGIGALTGVAVYVAAHAFVSSQDTQVVTSNDKVILFWWAVGAGALAGGTLGAVIGGIVGR